MSRKFNISAEATEYNDIGELPEADQKLLNAAHKAAKNAYAPYSGFNVGAAVLFENGTVVTGNNQENAAYPSGLCAERVALFHARALHPDLKIISVAVTASSAKKVSSPVPPCGACRQVMAEYEMNQKQPFRLIMRGETGKAIVTDSATVLLPLTFSSGDLK